jgi:iron complex outermembrane receptor protein
VGAERDAVINIITKRSQATKGGMVSVETGNEERGAATARAGFAPSDRIAYRVWGKADYEIPAYGSPGSFLFANQFIYHDPSIGNLDFGTTRLGFRADGQSGEHDSWTVAGDIYRNDRQDPSAYAVLMPSVVERMQLHTDYEGGFLQARWTHSISESRETVWQFAYDRNDIDYPFMSGNLNNATLDVQKRAPVGEHHEIYWGAGYQQYWDSIDGRFFAAFDPRNSVYRAGDVVVRDEWQLRPQWMASAGIRLDYNSYSHLEYQPSFRLLYTPNAKESVWFAASRAIRAPSRYDRDIQVNDGAASTPLGIPMNVGFDGSRNMRSETERSLELGYRRQSGQRWSVDVSTYWSFYGRLRALEGPLLPSFTWVDQSPVLVLPMTEVNAGSGRSYGGEIWAYWQVSPTWRLIPSYSYLNEARWLPASDTSQYAWDGRPATIGHQGLIRSQHDLTKNLQLDLMVRARSHDQSWDLPGVVLVDARLGWRPVRKGEISFSIEDLANRKVLECYSEGPTPAIPVRRTMMVKWTQRF